MMPGLSASLTGIMVRLPAFGQPSRMQRSNPIPVRLRFA